MGKTPVHRSQFIAKSDLTFPYKLPWRPRRTVGKAPKQSKRGHRENSITTRGVHSHSTDTLGTKGGDGIRSRNDFSRLSVKTATSSLLGATLFGFRYRRHRPPLALTHWSHDLLATRSPSKGSNFCCRTPSHEIDICSAPIPITNLSPASDYDVLEWAVRNATRSTKD